MDFHVRRSSRLDAVSLAPRLRASDVKEIFAASGQEPEEALLQSITESDSDMCWTAELDAGPEVMFGAGVIDDNVGLGHIWMLGSDRIYENPRNFMHHCWQYLAVMHTRYKYLTNFVSVEHQSANRWMRKLGFEPVQFTQDYGPIGHPFIQYISEADHV